ncbi:hypothetical protein EHF33_14635 [Deinococcus psychrotolerans]|uniref:PKD domain-containing protein n=1 Tax=Deinococcus psychrotolerans TaxID=2489213 RepID=A0A3G8YFM9_9DEIO|nr:hypothetical protein [Deinococcus psychrotolerans]AZI44139.1 hypothetical protein EHF33_14635 [Deinococcus psychrotolerans]
MKKYVAFAFLTLGLAACSQQAVQPAQSAAQFRTPPIGQGGQAYSTTSEALEAQVMADLNRRGFGDTLSVQGLAPQVYLNVLPVPTSDDSVRAYVKSNFTSPVTCSVTWGDGSTSTSVASPTVGRIETKDHAYATFGTYTITTSCVNGATVVGTQSVTVQAGKKATGTIIDFENPVVSDNQVQIYSSEYQEKGYSFTMNVPDGIYQFGKGSPFNFYTFNSSQTLCSCDNTTSLIMMGVVPSDLFTLTSFDYKRLESTSANFVLTGYKSDGSSLSVALSDSGDQMQTYQLGSAWTNLTKVTFGNDTANRNWLLVDNIHVSK